jgi:hypothetical protein
MIYCTDYTSESECGNDVFGVGARGCPAGTVCYCDWNATTNACTQAYNSPAPEAPGCTYKCSMAPQGYAAAECNEAGFKSISIKANKITLSGDCSSVVDENCKDRQVSVPCGLVEIELPLFGVWQLGASMVLVIAIYLIFYKRRKFFKE